MISNLIGCCSSCYEKYPFERALEGIAKAGLKYVEIDARQEVNAHIKPESLSISGMKEIKRLIEGYGLKPLSISGHCDLGSKEGIDLLKKRIDLAAIMEAEYVNTAGGRISGDEEINNFFLYMNSVKTYAKERGIIIALETHGGLLGRKEVFRETIERIGSDNVRINYDPANSIYFEGIRPESDILGLVDLIAHMHIKDKLGGIGEWNFPAIGEGYIDYNFILNYVLQNNYKGPFSFEIEFTSEGALSAEHVDEAIDKSLKHLNEIFDFIKGLMV